MNVRETEWQFDALDLRPVVRWLTELDGPAEGREVKASAGPAVTQVDVYLDTDDWRFHRAGYALRIRRLGRRREAEATLKGLETPSPGEPGLRNRREVSERLADQEPSALAGAEGPVGERVRAVAGRKPLLPLFEVRTRRRVFSLEADGLPPAELALDETTIRSPNGGAPARLRRVEVEVPEASLPTFGPFVDRLRVGCALQPASLSKYEAGLLSVDLRPPEAERFGATAIDAEMTIGAVALAVVRRHFSAMLAREPGTRLGDDIEELHDMRVASRRLRAALSLFAEVLPETVLRGRDELGWIGQTLGAVRDLDVQIEQLDEWLTAVPEADRDALAALGALLAEQHAAARTAMLEALDSRRYEAFVGRFGRTLRARHTARSGPSSRPALAVAPDLLESRFRAVRKAGRRIRLDSPATDYHRLRIRCKRFRYALEFLADLYPGETRTLVRRLVVLQDILGLHQDGDVAIARLRGLAAERGRELRPETVFAMGEIAERYRESMAELRARFPRAYARMAGRRWKRFRALLEARRPAPPQAAPPPGADARDAAG
jgi:triphosphatase